MTKHLFLIALLGFCSNFSAQTLKVQTDKASVKFYVVSDKTEGTLGNMQAEINFNLNDLQASYISGQVDVNTINTSNKKRDDHLKTADFFDAKKHPNIHFKSEKITATKEGFVMTGVLTMMGVTKEISINFTFENNVFKGTGEIFGLDFGLKHWKKRDDSLVKLKFEVPVA